MGFCKEGTLLIGLNPSMAWVSPGVGEGVGWQLEYQWPWSVAFTIIAILVLEAVVLAFYLGERGCRPGWLRIVLAQLRVLAFLLVGVMLSGLALGLFRTGLPSLAIVVDDSLSMVTIDRYPPQVEKNLRQSLGLEATEALSRWRIVQRLFSPGGGEWLESTKSRYRVQVELLSQLGLVGGHSPEELREQILRGEPTAPFTPLGSAVRQILDRSLGMGPAALVLLTDGINTEGPGLEEAARWARAANVPLFFVAIGQASAAADVELRDLVCEDPIFVGDLGRITCTLEVRGLRGKRITVVFKTGEDSSPRDSVTVEPREDYFRETLGFQFRPTQVGRVRLVVEASSPPEELSRDNNRLERMITVTDQRIRVLLAAGYPSYEFRFLKNLLARERTVELRTVLQEADPAHPQQDETAIGSFPTRLEDLLQFDVVILLDTNPRLLGTIGLRNLASFVDRPSSEGQGAGGGLIVVAGPRFLPHDLANSPLERLLPVELLPQGQSGVLSGEGYRPRPTPAGLGFPGLQLADNPQDNEALWGRLPPLFWWARLGSPKPGARVLLEHPSVPGKDGRPMPLLAFHYVGSGSVMIQGFDESWRWRWRVGDLFFGRYWIQTIRFLARRKLAAADRQPVLTTDRREYRHGEAVGIRLQFPEGSLVPPGDQVTIMVQREGGQAQPVQLARVEKSPGVFEGFLAKPQVGQYRLWYPGGGLPEQIPATEFRVLPPAGEFARLDPDLAGMQRAASLTGGLVLGPTEIGRLPEVLPPGQEMPLERLPSRPLWNSWPILLLFILVLGAEWILRKWAGMP